MIIIDQKTPSSLMGNLAQRVKARRKELRLTQAQLASKAGLSLSTYKRFERTGAIALDGLVHIAIAIGYEDDIDALFQRHAYASIQEVMSDVAKR